MTKQHIKSAYVGWTLSGLLLAVPITVAPRLFAHWPRISPTPPAAA